MQNEEITEDVELEEQDNEESEEDTDTESTEDESDESEDESEDDSDVADQLKSKDNEIAKLKRLLAKKDKPESKKKLITKPKADSVDVDERILISQGMDDELLSELKDIARAKKMTLMDAKKTPVFQAFEKQFEEEQKAESARLGASKGSGSKRVEKTFATPKLSKEEHRKMWDKQFKS